MRIHLSIYAVALACTALLLASLSSPASARLLLDPDDNDRSGSLRPTLSPRPIRSPWLAG